MGGNGNGDGPETERSVEEAMAAVARDEIDACAEISVHQRLRDAHPIGERLDCDAHALFRENIDGRIEQFSPALLGRKIALTTPLGPRGPIGGIVRLSTLALQHGACFARKARCGNVCLPSRRTNASLALFIPTGSERSRAVERKGFEPLTPASKHPRA
jgi:hypothetical protein